MTAVSNKWTIVQHSGYGYSHKPGFRRAVETRQLHTVGELKRVERNGGVVFDSYLDAETFAEKANFPPGTRGLYPQARGTFSSQMIDGLRIYKPVRAEPVG